MDFLAHVQGSDQGIAHPPSHPLLLVEQPSCPDGSRLLGDVHLSHQLHQEEDIAIGHLQGEDIQLWNAHRSQGFEEDLLGGGDEKQYYCRYACCHLMVKITAATVPWRVM